MIKRFLTLLITMVALSGSVEAALWDQLSNYFSPPVPNNSSAMKILIAHDKAGVDLEVKGRYKIFDPHTQEYITSRYKGKRRFLQPVHDGIKWGESFPGVFQILITPDHPSTVTIVDGIEYKGSIYVYDIGGSISIVNEVSSHEYLRSTLSSTLREPLQPEALAAVVIAARTDARYQKENAQNPYWFVEGSKVGYSGHRVNNPNDIPKALKVTHGMLLTNKENSKLFAVQWGDIINGNGNYMRAKISIDDAQEMAKNGDHAAQILNKAFPGSAIKLLAQQ